MFYPPLWKSHYHFESQPDRWLHTSGRRHREHVIAFSPAASSSCSQKQEKHRRSRLLRWVGNGVTIADEMERHDPEAADLISRPRGLAMVTAPRRSEGVWWVKHNSDGAWRGTRGEGVGTGSSVWGAWEALISPSSRFSGATSCTHAAVITASALKIPPSSPPGWRMWRTETSCDESWWWPGAVSVINILI